MSWVAKLLGLGSLDHLPIIVEVAEEPAPKPCVFFLQRPCDCGRCYCAYPAPCPCFECEYGDALYGPTWRDP